MISTTKQSEFKIMLPPTTMDLHQTLAEFGTEQVAPLRTT